MAKARDITVLEVSYEVCNKVGGIYTVITSKIPQMMQSLGDYIAIGPFYEKPSSMEFKRERAPPAFEQAFEALRKAHGINCLYGSWLIGGHSLLKERPKAILVDPSGFRSKLNDIKKELWEYAKVDSLTDDGWYNEPLPWSYACGLLIEQLLKKGAVKGRVIAHFHEWLTGAGMLYLKKAKSPVRTVFTTHGTMIGRAIAGSGREDLHSMISRGLREGRTLPDEKAREYGVLSKQTLEKASAQKADVMTAVSEVLGRECEFMLGRKPDVILPNGLDMASFPVMEDISDLHIKYRNRMRKFLAAYFCPYYPIDVREALIFFISGRFEFRNKGVDLTLDALGGLNRRLRGKTVVAFLWIPCGVAGRRAEVMDSLALYEDLERRAADESRLIGERIMDSFSMRRPLRKSSLLDEGFSHDLENAGLMIRKDGNPPVSPFVTDKNDITSSLEKNNLRNRQEDSVKVIYYPTYLSPNDGMLGMGYYNAIIGSHVGIFPSYYEPWGYTPLEAAALGCQSITSDLAGYGKFIKPHLKKGGSGITVIPRADRPYSESVKALEDVLYRICSMDKRTRVQQKIMAKQLSKLADWSRLIDNYLKAYEKALSGLPA